MNILIRSMYIAGGLLMTSVGVGQVDDVDELVRKDSQSFHVIKTEKTKKPPVMDSQIYGNKDYGTGNYSVIYQASSAAAVDAGGESTYAGSGCIYMPAGTTGLARYDIPLQIPTGHQILGMRYAFNDSSASSSQALLYSIDQSTGAFVTEHSVVSTGDTGYGSIYNSLTGGLDIDNGNYKYGIRFWSQEAGATQTMCALRIEVDSDPAP